MNSTVFLLDALPDDSFEGFDTGDYWNGWAVPLFTFEQAQKIVEAWRRRGWRAEYSAAADAFVFSVSQDLETGQSDVCDTFAGFERDGRKYYPIGSGVWIWEIGEELEELKTTVI